MQWLSLVLGLVKIAQTLAQWLAQRNLIDAGRAMAANEGLNRALEMLEASRNVQSTFDSLSTAARDRLRERYRRK